jgi:L-seryl-tRNA(Ser) seleniumtransferase
MGIYDELGVRRVINACSTATHLGGSIPHPRVMEAMSEASKGYAIMMELQDIVGERIAKMTGAEAAMVTSGAMASLQLGAAACLMRNSGLEEHTVKPYERLQPIDGPWREIMQRLPDLSGTRREIIIQRDHANPYEYAYKSVGGNLVHVGTPEGCSSDELEAAITESTAAIAFLANRESRKVSLERVIEIAYRHDIPVIVDAATSVLPRINLSKYPSMGADMVSISGGKQIRGPNDTGILCGKGALVEMAKLMASPFNGIGRGMKVDRTQMVGLLVALEAFLEKSHEDEAAEFTSWTERASWICSQLKSIPAVVSAEVSASKPWEARAMITFQKAVSARELAFKLREGGPSIWVETNMTGDDSVNRIGIAIDSLLEGEEKEIVGAIKTYLRARKK